ncbi:winged helix-turn-helix transcriptional regulator [Trabulsiella odontotermitis]|uniref:IprA winged helix-turn-helix domain-containing protein n=1 Tax=Trabulsiella odontotermitis TaxID=379893 RepID=A0A0L0H0E6_9ENTR|nr:winged helix-turn-helix transcriptional regulator [Trabulsiella odontotermitis]KNC88196.1 hypothetical protein GM30_12655 [Trabulsiella odontotermitis]KNC94930.1 hypothetical protein GM31_09725 [Trabulsiella odontotermitis]
MKPSDHIQRLTDALSRPENIRTARPRQLISLRHIPEPMVCVLHEGIVGIFRESDHLLVAHLYAPFVLGFALTESPQQPHIYLKTRNTVRYEMVPRQQALSMFDQQQLWKSVAWVQGFMATELFRQPASYVGQSSYQLIRQTLLAFMQEEELLRQNMTALEYLQERTLLSRSGIQRILSELKKGDYISLENGKLLAVRHLPERF